MRDGWLRRNLPEIGVFGLLVFMMAFRLMHSPPWGDEWNEYIFSQRPFAGGSFYKAVADTFQPPLYNLLMHAWLSLGKSLLWFRLFNLPIGLACGLLLYASVRDMAGRRMALASVGALAVCHQWVWCIQECSEYALMVFFLFLALRFYIKTIEAFSPSRFLLFLVGCVGSVWSQYGAVFVALPLLLSLYIRTVFARGASRRRRLAVTGAYVFCALVFALPLHLFFLKAQMAHNQIADNTVTPSLALLADLPVVLGRILGFFYALRHYALWRLAEPVAGIALFLLLLAACAKPMTPPRSGLARSALACYLLHFALVKLQVYAMVRPGESYGFLCRYSFFWIPLLAFLLPVLADELCRTLPRGRIRRATAALLAVFAVLCAFGSFRLTLRNWHKAYDDQFADIWVSNEGWKHRTYLLGFSKPGFDYWVGRLRETREFPLDNVRERLDKPIPDTFWVWSANWNQQTAQKLIRRAWVHRYNIRFEFDDGTNILAFCQLKGEPAAPTAPTNAPALPPADDVR